MCCRHHCHDDANGFCRISNNIAYIKKSQGSTRHNKLPKRKKAREQSVEAGSNFCCSAENKSLPEFFSEITSEVKTF